MPQQMKEFVHLNENIYIQTVTERHMVIEDDWAYFTLSTNVREQGEGI